MSDRASARALGARADELAQRWGLVLGPAYDLSQNWVAPATRSADGADVVLKLAVPVGPGTELAPLALETRALSWWDGRGAVRLVEADLALGAVLLERCEPGTRVAEVVKGSDAEATDVLVDTLLRLHDSSSGRDVSLADLPQLADERDSFTAYLADYLPDDPECPLPYALVQRADAVFGELLASAPDVVVLHGDLHHDNVLAAAREPWLAIDPHGVVGDPGYDVGAIFYNPWIGDRDPALLRLVDARIERVAAGTGIPLDRVVAWAFVKAVLSELWTWEDGEDPGTRALDVAELLHPRLR